jgi:two-component system, cell cycle sensor histidine kinase and response regulator CckA
MKILYLEDNRGDAKLLQYAFAETFPSFQVEWVDTYDAAIKKLSLCSPDNPCFDLILTDMYLPDGNGLSLLPFVRERGLSIPIVVITGLGDEESAINALKAGVDDYIIKRGDYLTRLPSVLNLTINKHRIEAARRSDPLQVLYCEQNLKDIESARSYLAAHAPYFILDVVSAYEEVLERFSLMEQETRGSVKPCDIVLLNYQMNNITAIDLLKELRGVYRTDVPVVITSNEDSMENAAQALRLGADDYIVKNSGYLLQLPFVLENAFNKVQVQRERAALKASENHFRLLIENASDLIMVLDKDGVIRYCSPSIKKVMGILPEELVGRRLDEDQNIHPDDLLIVTRQHSELINNPGLISAPIVLRIKTKDSSWIYEESIARSTVDASGQVIVIINSRDITDKKKAEEALLSSETRFRALVEKSGEAISLIESTGKPIYVSPPVKELLGYSEEEFVALERHEIVHPDDSYKIDEAISDMSENPGKTVAYSIRLHHKDGTWRWIENSLHDLRMDPSVKAIISNFRDITAQKDAEDSLQESEAKYRGLVENSLVGVGIFQNDKCMFVNKKLCEMLGYTYEEMMGTSYILNLIHPADKAVMNETVRRIFELGEPVESDFRVIRKDDKILNVKGFFSSLIFYGRRAIAGTIIDTTRERLLENQLRQSHKMEAIGTLAGGIAHDFNNILTVLTGYGTLLKMESEKGIPIKKNYLNSILSASSKAANLTQSLLAFARQQPISLKPVSLNGIIIETEKMLRRLLTEDIVLKTILSPDNIIVMADSTQIDQILINLVVNARDAMPRGGSITLETRTVDIGINMAKVHGLEVPGRYALLSVSDTGSGMDDATKEHLFEPFFTTKEVGKGTGLGLSTVYGIVKQHNGHITAYSEKNTGTTFHIYLPIINAMEVKEPPQVQPPGGTERILLAEDNEEVREFMTTVLSRSGYDVIVAVDGEDAIEHFRNHKGISLLILDSVMPKKNGRQVYDEISAAVQSIKVIFTSGYTRDVVLDKGIEDKKYDFIAKPVSPVDLLRKVREVLDRL